MPEGARIPLDEEVDFGPMPAGEYLMQCERPTGPDPDKDSNPLLVRIVIAEGDYANRSVLHNLPMQGKGIGITKEFITKLDLPTVQVMEEGEGKQKKRYIGCTDAAVATFDDLAERIKDEVEGVYIRGFLKVDTKWDNNKLGSFKRADEESGAVPF